MIMKDSITLATDTLAVQPEGVRSLIQSSIWFWISLVQFLVIIILIIRYKRIKGKPIIREIRKEIIKEAGKEDIDMEELMANINKAGRLYKTLSSKCHPDRFINSPKYLPAEEIFQEITRYKRNYKELCALRERAINELNVKL